MSADRSRPRPLLIGVGNRDRGDDAVGPFVVDELRDRHDGHFDYLVAAGDLSDLALRWRREQSVTIVDAMMSGRQPGTTVEIDCLAHPLEVPTGHLSSHGVGLSDAIELGRSLELLPVALRVLAVEAEQFEHGAPLSSSVAAAAVKLVDRLPAIMAPEAFLLPAEGDDQRLDHTVGDQ